MAKNVLANSGFGKKGKYEDINRLANIATPTYGGKINYEDLGIADVELVKKLKRYEADVERLKTDITKKTFELSETIYKAQNILADRNGGVFIQWIETLGISKSTAYNLLDRYNIFVEYNSKKVFDFTARALVEFKKLNKNEKTKNVAMEILEAENPSIKLKELKPVIEEAIVVEEITEELELKELELKLSKLDIKIEFLNKQRDEILSKISEIKR